MRDKLISNTTTTHSSYYNPVLAPLLLVEGIFEYGNSWIGHCSILLAKNTVRREKAVAVHSTVPNYRAYHVNPLLMLCSVAEEEQQGLCGSTSSIR
jgi:hypothetical protein